MTIDNDRPLFNLKAVVQETGIKPDTLRAWERRYGIPLPQRTDGGHRLYSQREIDTIKWLLSQQQTGMNISQAVALWHEFVESGEDPLNIEDVMYSDAATSQLQHAGAVDHRLQLGQGIALDKIREQWIVACLAFDERSAEQALTNAFAAFPVETVVREVIQRGVSVIGEGWHAGRVTVQQEHFATGLAVRRVEALLAAAPPPTRRGRILVSCPPNETHSFAPLILSLLLRRKGWNVINLGADVPVQSLELTIRSAAPNLVVLTAQQLHTAASMLDAAEAATRSGVPLAFGGRIFNIIPDIVEVIPGHFMGTDLYDAVLIIEQLMIAPKPKAALREVSQAHKEALRHFRERRAQIEADTEQSIDMSEMDRTQLEEITEVVGREIESALVLGNLRILGNVSSLIANAPGVSRSLTQEQRAAYLFAYRHACQSHLDARSAVVVDWLDSIAGENPDDHNFSAIAIPAAFLQRGKTNEHSNDRRDWHDRQGASSESSPRRPPSNSTHAQSGSGD